MINTMFFLQSGVQMSNFICAYFTLNLFLKSDFVSVSTLHSFETVICRREMQHKT